MALVKAKTQPELKKIIEAVKKQYDPNSKTNNGHINYVRFKVGDLNLAFKEGKALMVEPFGTGVKIEAREISKDQAQVLADNVEVIRQLSQTFDKDIKSKAKKVTKELTF